MNTPNTINGRTPEEIKKGLECCKPKWKSDHWVTCRDECPFRNEHAFCKNVLLTCVSTYIQRLELLQSRWISVNDKLPEDDLPENSNVKSIKVLVAIKGKTGIVMRTQLRRRRLLYDTRSEPFLEWEWSYSAGKVTHWMNLPELPEDN